MRVGSTFRVATDAEIILMRAVEESRKVGMLKRRLDEGDTRVVFWQLGEQGRDFTNSPRVENAEIIEINENWVVLKMSGTRRAFPYCEFNLGWDPEQNLLQILYHGGH